jgi:hypothetical protein
MFPRFPCRWGWLCSSPALPPAESAGVRSVVKLEILAALDKLGDDLPPTMLGVGVPVIFGDMERVSANSRVACARARRKRPPNTLRPHSAPAILGGRAKTG